MPGILPHAGRCSRRGVCCNRTIAGRLPQQALRPVRVIGSPGGGPDVPGMFVARRVWLRAAALALAMVGALVVAPSASASTAGSFVSLVNSARASAGLKGYAVSSQLTSVALGQAERMASQQRLYHNPGLAT